MVGDLPTMLVASSSLIGGNAPYVEVTANGDVSSDGTVSVDGVAPYTLVVDAGAVSGPQCTGVETAEDFWPGSIHTFSGSGLSSAVALHSSR